jgi:phosphatidylserine/phosphatidylglycerophosphate/cardiolipin synthase-like enzyme
MTTEPTSGLWDVDEGDFSIFALDESGGAIPLFQIHEECDGNWMPFEEAQANAWLAASAQHMLEALKAAKELIDVALPCFNWGQSLLSADAIRLLNEVPIKVSKALDAAKGDR